MISIQLACCGKPPKEHMWKEGMSLGRSLPTWFSCASKTHHLEFGHAKHLTTAIHFHGLASAKELSKEAGFGGSWQTFMKIFFKNPFITVTAMVNLLSIQFFGILNRKQGKSISKQWNIGLLFSASDNYILTSFWAWPRGLM